LHKSTRDLLIALKVARRTLTAQYSTHTESVLLLPQHWAQDMMEGKNELNTQNTLINVYFNHIVKGNQQYQIIIPINDKAEMEV
jgi:hypothetical protein